MENQEQQTQSIQPQVPVQPTLQPSQPFVPKKSLPKWPLIIAGVILFATFLTGAYFLGQKSNNKIACTTEAKLCPDGSTVGRTGPKCEFTPCPKTPTPTLVPISSESGTLIATNTANWKTYTNSTFGFSLKYPGDWDINDQSYPESQGIKAYIGFAISAPFRTDISETNGEKAQYLRMVHWDPALKVLVANDASGKLGNFIYAKNPQDQAVRNVDVNDSFITNSQEYLIGNQILSTFKFTQ